MPKAITFLRVTLDDDTIRLCETVDVYRPWGRIVPQVWSGARSPRNCSLFIYPAGSRPAMMVIRVDGAFSDFAPNITISNGTTIFSLGYPAPLGSSFYGKFLLLEQESDLVGLFSVIFSTLKQGILLT